MDFSLFKWELSDYNYEKLRVWVDLGFQGIKKILKNTSIRIPIKKNKNVKRSEHDKSYNREISRVRVRVEHGIGGMKRYGILQHRCRLKSSESIVEITELCTGLWNFKKNFTVY